MKNALRLSAAVAAVCILAAFTQAQQPSKATNHEKVLYTFTGETDGYLPNGTLVRDSEGNLYGTTQRGGDNNCDEGGCGVVFKLDTTGRETVLYSFTGGSDGANPIASLIQDSAGNLYGTASAGGIFDGACVGLGCGVVFKLQP